MKKIFIVIIVLTSLVVFDDTSNAGCLDCQMQCVVYARNRSGINIRGGTAIEWLGLASQRGYDVTNKPKKGRVIILEPNQHGVADTGHAIYIEDSEKKDGGKYSLRIAHSNFDCKCGIETNIKASLDKDDKELKIKSGAWSGRKYKIAGIISR